MEKKERKKERKNIYIYYKRKSICVSFVMEKKERKKENYEIRKKKAENLNNKKSDLKYETERKKKVKNKSNFFN